MTNENISTALSASVALFMSCPVVAAGCVPRNLFIAGGYTMCKTFYTNGITMQRRTAYTMYTMFTETIPRRSSGLRAGRLRYVDLAILGASMGSRPGIDPNGLNHPPVIQVIEDALRD